MISQSSLPVIFQLLKDDTPADVFFAALTGQEVAGASADQGREMDLALALYSELLHHIENQTFFGIQACRLIAQCVARFSKPADIVPKVREYIRSQNLGVSEAISFQITFSFAAREYRELFELLEAYLNWRRDVGTIDSTLLVATRSVLAITHIVHALSENQPLPLPARAPLQRNFPGGRAREFAAAVETQMRRQAASMRRQRRPVSYEFAERSTRILFAMDDFVNEPLNTLTKMYCDFLYVLAKFTDVSLVVRVYSITKGYTDTRMPAIWNPPVGKLSELFERYFGDEGKALVAARIDVAHLNLWEYGSEDYVSPIASDIEQINPDVCVTCVERLNSFLENVLYELAPLIQIEVINGSAFVRHCDALVPNGTVSEERARKFNCVISPLPQIPYPVVEQISKETLGLKQQDYVLAVVAKEFPRRLRSENKLELSMAFAAKLVALQEKHANLALLLVGETEAGIAEWFSEAGVTPDPQRLKIIPFAQDLRAVMQASDLIVNPPQRGGGRGMAIAISDSLPVLVFQDADATNFVPADNVCNDVDELAEKVSHYYTLGPGFRESYISVTGEVPFSEAYNRRCAISFVEAAVVAREIGTARLNEKADAAIYRQLGMEPR